VLLEIGSSVGKSIRPSVKQFTLNRLGIPLDYRIMDVRLRVFDALCGPEPEAGPTGGAIVGDPTGGKGPRPRSPC
jgi:hypothetical protein